MAKRTTGADGTTTVRGKRANGGGSVYFEQANECYFATWRDSDGKRRKVRPRVHDKAAALGIDTAGRATSGRNCGRESGTSCRRRTQR